MLAMVDGVANLLSLFHAYIATGLWQDQPASNLLDGAAPFYRCYACKDGGHVAVGAIESQFFAQLLAGLEIPADRFDQNDTAQWPEMIPQFTGILLSRTRDEWEAVFAGTDACVSPVLSMTEAMEHPANASRQAYVTHAGVRQSVPATRFSGTPGRIGDSSAVSAAEVLASWSRG